MESDAEAVRFGAADYGVFCIGISFSLLIGVYYACSGGKQKTSGEFLLANRSMGTVPVAFSLFASCMSAIILLSAPAEVYAFGGQYSFMMFSYMAVIPIAAYLYVPVFYNLGVTSVYEYLERRFNRTIRNSAASIFIMQMVVFLAAVTYAPALALSHATGIHLWASVGVMIAICTIYTTIGGIKAVMWTDVLQTLITFAAMIVVTVKGCLDLGGFDQVWKTCAEGERLEFFNFSLDPTVRQSVWTQTVGGLFIWLGVFGVNQMMVQRYMSTPSVGSAQRALWMCLVWLVGIQVMVTMVGFNVYTRYKDCDPLLSGKITRNDQLMPLYALEVLAIIPGLPGLFIAGVFSGSLSTLSSGLNSLSAVILQDFVRGYLRKEISEEAAGKLAKVVAFGFGVLCLIMVALVQHFPTLAEASLGINGTIGGPMLGLFTLGMFCPCANAWGAGIGLWFGLFVASWLCFGSMVNPQPPQRLPVSVQGCPNSSFVASAFAFQTSNESHVTIGGDFDDGFSYIYRVAFMWYSVIAFLLVVIVGLVTSFFTGGNKSETDPRLFSPFVRRLLVGRRSLKPPIQEPECKTKVGSITNGGTQNGEIVWKRTLPVHETTL